MQMWSPQRQNPKHIPGTIHISNRHTPDRPNKLTAFTGSEVRSTCRSLKIKILYGTPNILTATELVSWKRQKTFQELLKTILAEKCSIKQAIYRSLMAMRTTANAKLNETPFKRHYGRGLRAKINRYLNVPASVVPVLVKPEWLQTYSFANGDGEHDQLVMKTPRKLKCGVSSNFSNQFLETKHEKQIILRTISKRNHKQQYLEEHT